MANLKTILGPNKPSTKRVVVTHGELVGSSAYESDDDCELSQDELSSLLWSMPRLKIIDLEKSQHTEAYLKILLNLLEEEKKKQQ